MDLLHDGSLTGPPSCWREASASPRVPLHSACLSVLIEWGLVFPEQTIQGRAGGAPVFCEQASEVPRRHFLYLLFVRSKSLRLGEEGTDSTF